MFSSLHEIIELASEDNNQSFVDTLTKKLLENKYHLMYYTTYEEKLQDKFVNWPKVSVWPVLFLIFGIKFKELQEETIKTQELAQVKFELIGQLNT